MSISNDALNVYSMNCQGLRNKNKRYDVINYLKSLNSDILCLQDTHLKTMETNFLQEFWDGKVVLNGFSTNSRGVGILFNHAIQYDILQVLRDENGNMLTVLMEYSNKKILLINAYGPNTDNQTFFQKVNDHIDAIEHDYFILCGDLNVTLDPSMDTYNYVRQNNLKSRDTLLKVMDSCSLVDIYRHFKPDSRRYTWRRKNPIK